MPLIPKTIRDVLDIIALFVGLNRFALEDASAKALTDYERGYTRGKIVGYERAAEIIKAMEYEQAQTAIAAQLNHAPKEQL